MKTILVKNPDGVIVVVRYRVPEDKVPIRIKAMREQIFGPRYTFEVVEHNASDEETRLVSRERSDIKRQILPPEPPKIKIQWVASGRWVSTQPNMRKSDE